MLGVLAVALPMNPVFAAPQPPSAGGPQATGDGQVPARLSYLTGSVSFWRPGAEDWSPAELNTPLYPGDALYTGEDGNIEVQIGARAFRRAAPGTELGLTNREPNYDQLEVKSGRAALDVRDLAAGQTIEIDTPHAAFIVETPGYYRIDVGDGATTFAAHRGGRARLVSASGATSLVSANEQVVVEGVDDVQVANYPAANLDAWDRWNYDRTDQLIESASARYVSSEVYGLDELDRYGTWRQEQEYGPVWVPSGVGADWAPYSDGRWIYDPYYGWTWIDAAPWGWAPSHYGRWVRTSGYWGWAPGPIVAAPYYSPAVVGFYGGDNFSISFGIGAPTVGWVALGWGEPIIPWWGSVGFVGVPWWGGWGGPWVVNNVIIHDYHDYHHHHHHPRIHAGDIHDYRHGRERHALRWDREDRFGRGRPRRHDWREVRDNDRLEPLRDRFRTRPVSASLSPREGRGSRPPDRIRQRQVVATRAGRDNTERLRAAGLRAPDRERSRQRVVNARPDGRQPRDARGVTERERPALRERAREQQGAERSTREANVPDRLRERRGQQPRGAERNLEERPSGRGRSEQVRPPVPRAERPAQRERSRAAEPRVERPGQSRERVRPARPDAPAARSEQPARRERQSGPAPRAERPARPERQSAPAPRVERPAQRERSRGAESRVERPAAQSRERVRPSRPDAPAARLEQPARRQRQNAPAARSEQPARRERQSAPAPRAERPARRERSAPAQRREAFAPQRERSSRPSASTAERSSRRERAHAPAPRFEQPRSSARTEMRSRQAPASQPRQMRERSQSRAQPRNEARQPSRSAPSAAAPRGGGETRSAQRGNARGGSQRADRSTRGER